MDEPTPSDSSVVIDGAYRSEAAGLPRPLGRYVLLSRLARGGMGEVFVAMRGDIEGAERLVVLKTVRPDLAGEPDFVARFLDEGRILCQLQHSTIAAVHEVGTARDETRGDAETYYLAMEHVEGKTLAQLIVRAHERGLFVPVPAALGVIGAVLDGLDHAHRRVGLDGKPLGLIHRDVSPQNVLVSYGGDTKIIDFGTAKATVRRLRTTQGYVLGKPGYLAPEQARAPNVVDARSDLFAVGVVLWETLAGARFSRSADPEAHLRALAAGTFDVRPLAGNVPGVTARLDAVIARALADDPASRFQDAQQFRAALEQELSTHWSVTVRQSISSLMRTLFAEEMEHERAELSSLVEKGKALRSRLPNGPATIATARSAAATATDSSISAPFAAPARAVRSPSLGRTAAAGDRLLGTRYRSLDRLPGGPLGERHLVENVDTGVRRAMTITAAEAPNAPDDDDKLTAALRRAARVADRRVVAPVDWGRTEDGRFFFVSRVERDATLAEALARGRPLPATRATKLVRGLAEALGQAHRAGVLHRALRPELVRWGGGDPHAVALEGLGLLAGLEPAQQAIAAGHRFVSPTYAAPEQIQGQPLDERTDVYALGVLFYELLAGRPPLLGTSPIETLSLHLGKKPAPVRDAVPSNVREAITPAIESLVMSMLEKSPSERPRTMREVATSLGDDRKTDTIAPRGGAERARWVLLAIGATLTLGAGAAVAWWWLDR